MARVMRDATVLATAEKLFKACGPSYLDDSFDYWRAAAKAWAVGATRPLSHEDLTAIIKAIEVIEDVGRRAMRA